MGEKVFARDVSPYFQQLLVRLMEEAYRARKSANVAAYRVALEHLYDSLPEYVRAEVLQELSKRLGMKVDDLPDVLMLVDEECRRIMSRYGVSIHDKQAECTEKALRMLNAVYGVLTAKIHEKGLLMVTKPVPVGYA